MSIYDDMQGLAAGLLGEFDQGGLALSVETPGTGPAYNPGPSTWADTNFTGTCQGVNESLLADSMVQASDLLVTMPGHLLPAMNNRVKINGVYHSIVKIMQKPAAGVPVVWQVVCRK